VEKRRGGGEHREKHATRKGWRKKDGKKERNGEGQRECGGTAGQSRCSFNPTTTTTAALHIIPV